MRIRSMIVALALTAGAGLGVYAALPASAEATASNPCNLSGWYVNDDETAAEPTRTFDGFTFEGKDLIHHKAPSDGIDFADMDHVLYSFTATVANKVVYKMETSAPYSTIVTNADGKLWSTAMSAEQIGGQSNPVEKFTDFLGKPVKPGKVAFSGTSQVETFGVGYWVEPGATVVKSISFHGVTYPLSCKAPIALVQAKYNPSGTDIGNNLINEYVQIQNKGTFPVNLTGYTVRNRAAKIYTFGDVTLNGGAKLAVRTGNGTATATSVYQGSVLEIWKDADAATLRDPSNATLDSCVWTKSASGLTAC